MSSEKSDFEKWYYKNIGASITLEEAFEAGRAAKVELSWPSDESCWAAAYDYTTENGGDIKTRKAFCAGIEWIKALELVRKRMGDV